MVLPRREEETVQFTAYLAGGKADGPPGPARIARLLGPAMPAWELLLQGCAELEPVAQASWKYYADGGWLCRVQRGTKTLAWLALREGYATATCYFAERHRDPITEIPGCAWVAEVPMIGRMLPVQLELRTAADAGLALELLRAKGTWR
ncbi:hypothetical protein GCM10009805_23890 [Leucobacter chromiireducens subsp. solipictus]|uniref:DUF3788 family protein n=1 Tax=Leucobacter chromiireducens subsp. solipictus TaxID=398235 RepID=A0ABS1SEF3_9MICO|nr:DUF3788 family protein [Leucobacter chromiireducens subsp. solipictus]